LANHSSDKGLARLIERWVDFVQHRPRATLVVSLIAAAISLAYALNTLHFSTQRTDLLRPDHPVLQDFNRLRREFDRESDMIVVAAGPNPVAIVPALERIAGKLRERPDLFEKTLDRVDVSALRKKGLYQLPIEQLRDLERNLAPLALVSRAPFSWIFAILGWEPVSIEATLQNQQSGAESARIALLQSLERFLRTDGRQYVSPFAGLAPQSAEAVNVDDPETKGYIFSPDRRLALIRVFPIRDPTSFVGLGAPVAELRRISQEAAENSPGVEIGLTGLPILEDDEMQTAMSSSLWAGALEFVGVMLVFFVGFRAFRHPMLIQLALVVAGCWTLGMVAVTVGRLNILSMTFIITLIGMGVDFGVVWLTRFESARAAGWDAYSSNRTTAVELGPGVVSGAVSTTIAFYATMATEFVGLRDMGWIAGTGILICLLSMLTVLPATLALWSRKRAIPIHRGRRDLEPAFPMAARRPWTTLVLSGVAALLLAAPLPWLRSDYNLLHLQATGLPSVAWEHRLMREMKASGWYMQLSAAAPQEARRLKKDLEALPQVGRIVEVASLLPSDQSAKQPIIAKLHQYLQEGPDLGASGSVDQHSLLRRLQKIAGANGDMGSAASAALAAVNKTQGAARENLLSRFHARWRADMEDRLRDMRDASCPEPVAIADLPPTLLERYRGKTGRWLLHVFPKTDSWDFAPLESFVNTVRSVDAHATGEPATSLLGVVELVDGFKRSAWLAALAVFVACWIDLRSFRLAALAMAPLVMGCAAAFGIMSFVGMTINPANMIGLPLILGLGVDFGVHVLHDYAHAPGGYVLKWRLARALVLTTATTIVGFSSLLISGHWGMISIGVLLSLGVACCSAAALFMLPAVLQLLPAPQRAGSAVLRLPERAAEGTPVRQAA